MVLITAGLALAVLQATLGLSLVPGMNYHLHGQGDAPGATMRAIEVIGFIACVLLGAYPMVFMLTRWFERPLMKVGGLLGMNNSAAAGMVATLANSIPMFGLMSKMDDRGKVINVAFAVSAAFTFGDHLGFTAANVSSMIFPMIVGKLVGGFSAVLLAMRLAPKPADDRLRAALSAQQG